MVVDHVPTISINEEKPYGSAGVHKQRELYHLAGYSDWSNLKAGLDESQAGIKIAGRNINNLRYADDTTLIAENEEELENFLMEVKEERAKNGLKFNINNKKTTTPNTMVTGPITSWQTEGEDMEAVTDFTFLDSISLQMETAATKLKDACFLGGKQ